MPTIALVGVLAVLGGCATTTTGRRGHKAWADVVADSRGVVIVRRRGTTYQSFVVVEPNRICEIGDFRNPDVQNQPCGGRDLVKVKYTALFGTNIHYERMAVVVLQEHVPAKFANIPAGGHIGSEWGMGNRSARIATMDLQGDTLQVKYVLSRDGASEEDEHLLQTYTLSTDPEAWQECGRVWQHLGFRSE